MSIRTSYPEKTFDLAFLTAVNEWQIGSNTKKGKKIKKLSKNLPSYFCECELICFRRVSLKVLPTIDLLLDCLDEKISSWTYSIDTAMGFKGGVPPKRVGQGVILHLKPSSSQVILNLDRLYHDQGFLDAINKNRHNIPEYARGIGRYYDTQAEVILHVESISTKDVYSLGGYSSNPQDLLLKANFATGLPLEYINQYLLSMCGANWLSYQGTQNVLERMIPRVLRYRNVRNIKQPSIFQQL